MQVAFGNTVPVLSAMVPSATPEKGVQTAIARVDLQSPLAPVQPLAVAAQPLPVSSSQPLVYSRPSGPSPGAVAARDAGRQPIAATPEERDALPLDAGAKNAVRERPPREDSGGSLPAQRPRRETESEEDGTTESAVTENSERGDRREPRTGGGGQYDGGMGLDEAQLQQIAEMARRDREVRQHEQAHVSVGGQYASAPRYSFERGPDGRSYATGGEVSIDVSPVSGNPEATIRKMEAVRRAALAVAEPSPQDRAVAASAVRLAMQARTELNAQRAEKASAAGGGRDPSATASAGSERAVQVDSRRRGPEVAGAGSESSDGTGEVAEQRRSEAVRAYTDLIRLGIEYARGLVPVGRISEFV